MTAKPQNIGLPVRPFLYTLDQIATLIDISVAKLKQIYLHFAGRSVGPHRADKILTHDISPRGKGLKPEWRVSEQELVRWLRFRGFRVHERTWAAT